MLGRHLITFIETFEAAFITVIILAHLIRAGRRLLGAPAVAMAAV